MMTLTGSVKLNTSTAVVTTLMCGFYFTMTGIFEVLSCISRRPVDWSEVTESVRQSILVGMGLIVVSLLLWGRPRIGAFALIFSGIVFYIWIVQDWSIPVSMGDWMLRILLVGLPIGSGITILGRDKISGRQCKAIR